MSKSLVDGVLYAIFHYHSKGFRVLYEDVYELKKAEQNDKSFERTLRTTLSRMKKNKFLSNEKGLWRITKEGEELLNSHNSDIIKFFPKQFSVNKKEARNLIVIFDIPEKKKRYREWLRSELTGFGFSMIQKSVWLGPSLPKEFIEYLSEADLLKFLRFFRASENDLI